MSEFRGQLPEEFVTVEVTLGKEKLFEKLKVPIVSNRKKGMVLLDNQFAVKEIEITGG